MTSTDSVSPARDSTPSTTAPLALDDALCFALYTASRAVTQLYRPLLDDLGLTYPQYIVMLALWERDGVPVKTLGDRLRLDYGTLSPLLKRLAARGLIRRERRPDDERIVTISLTDQGRDLRTGAACIPDAITSAMGLTESEFSALNDTLHRLTAAVGEHPHPESYSASH
ncbi:MAG TPA: MarR family winged helix-turn-helix transcriptional regulator [Solirubrobacteraceae bacterium]